MLARGELWLLVAFTLLLGASQGVITIVRGAVPLALFGTEGYGAVLGLIATPILLVNAFSPALFALIVDQVGWHNALYVLLASSILTWIAIELMSRWYEGDGAESAGATSGPPVVSGGLLERLLVRPEVDLVRPGAAVLAYAGASSCRRWPRCSAARRRRPCPCGRACATAAARPRCRRR